MTEINYLEILKLCFLGGKGGCAGCPFKNEGFPKCLNIVYKGIEDTINNQKAELERLECSVKQWEGTAKDLYISRENIKAEVVKEFLKKQEIELANNTDISAVGYQSVIELNIKILKEMGIE